MSLIIKKNTTFKIPRTPPISFLGLALWLKADTGVTLGISQIIISGFTGIYTGANGTYNYNYEENYWFHSSASYYINSSGELKDDNDQTVIATNNNNFQGAWSPTNYFSTITISNAGIPSVNGVYTRSDPTNIYSQFTASGGRSIVADDNEAVFWFTNPNGAYQNNDPYLGAAGWFAVDDGGNITAVNSTSVRNVGSPTSTTVADLVTAWADQSGNGNNANSNDSASKPLFSSSSINSKPAVLFRNSSWMVTPANSIGSDGNVTIFVALRNNVEEASTKFLIKKGDSAVYQNEVWAISLVEGFGFVDINEEIWSFSQYTLPASTSILTAISSVGESSVFRNGTSVGDPSTTAGVSPNSSSQSIGIGASNNGSYGGIDADIAEIIIYSRTLTTPERQEIEAYLNSKYQIY
jgi:hypothetical protein